MVQGTEVDRGFLAASRRSLESRQTRERILHVSLYVVLTAISLMALVPIFYMMSTSLKAHGMEYEWPMKWIPDPVVWKNYLDAHTVMPFHLYYRNTIAIAGISTAGAMLTATMAGYAFARLRFVGRNVLFILTLSTMMLPGIVTLVPTFLIFRQLGWINTLYPMIVPHVLGGGAFFIFLSRQFFMSIPYELEEAARIDGAASYRIYWRIMLPLAGPVLAVIGVFSFVSRWTDFLEALVYLNTENVRTVAVGLALNSALFGENRNFIMASSFTMALPIIVLFFFAQRYFMRGIVMTGIAGR